MSLVAQIRGTVEAVVREVLTEVIEPLLADLETRVKALEDSIPAPKTPPVANATRAKAATATAKGSGS